MRPARGHQEEIMQPPTTIHPKRHQTARPRPHRRWWIAALLFCALLAVAAGRTPGARPVHADSDDEFIKTVVAHADLEDQAEIDKLTACLQQKLSAGVSRYAAIGPCFIQATVPTSGDELLAGLLDPENQATLDARAAAAKAQVDLILKQLKDNGATQGELD